MPLSTDKWLNTTVQLPRSLGSELRSYGLGVSNNGMQYAIHCFIDPIYCTGRYANGLFISANMARVFENNRSI
jgi:hypothetical protein